MKHKTQRIKNVSSFKFQVSSSGFSLIEILVAVSLFAVAATISTGALMSITDAQQKILALRIVQDNISYALDVMGKEIRTGTSYHCGSSGDITQPQDCALGDTYFAFSDALTQRVVYCLGPTGSDKKCFDAGAKTTLKKSIDGGNNFQDLTSPDLIIINNLSFYVVGAQAGDKSQPRVTIILKGTAGIKEKIKSSINIQTTISQRLLDS